MRACVLQGLQPRGGSDAEADFAEQVNVWILECPLEATGARGPKASFANTPRAPKRHLQREGRVTENLDTVHLYKGKCGIKSCET